MSGKREIIYLWGNGAAGVDPSAVEDECQPGKFRNIRNPSLEVFPPKVPGDSAVVICPGGGYGMVSSINEGWPVGEWLSGLGVTAFVLKYRLPTTEGVNYKHPVPLSDAQKAMRIVRGLSSSMGFSSNKTGVAGFSAGGHLAATAGTLFYSPVCHDSISCRPDFMILVYPVISFTDGDNMHTGSRSNLVPADADEKLLHLLSPEKQVTSNTPSAYLVHAKNDKGVPCGNSLMMAEALEKAGVPVEVFLSEKGGHGFGLGQKDNDSSEWPRRCAAWLKRSGFIAAS